MALLWISTTWWCCLSLFLTAVGCTVAQAQEQLGTVPLERSQPPLPPLLEPPPSTPPSNLILPPAPLLPQTPSSSQVRVLIREIRVTGSTAFAPSELSAVTAPYVNRELVTEDLEALRLALTRLYIDKGYINSGAVIPDQTVHDGVLTLNIIEGQLTSIEVEGNRWFRSRYLQEWIALSAKPPLNIFALQERLQLLQQDPRVTRFDAELVPGVQRGESLLRLHVEESNPWKVELAFNNYQSPTVGAERGLITLTHRNFSGYGDTLSATYGRSAGIDVQIDASYTRPLTVYDTTLSLRYRYNDFLVIEAPFKPLDIESTSNVYSLTLRQPVYRTPTNELSLALHIERLHNETFLLGEPFSFSPGAEKGKTTVAALRLTCEWIHRTPKQVLALRSRFAQGMDAFGATIHDDSAIPDSRFFAWLGQFQWLRHLDPWGVQLLTRLDIQLTDDPLLPLEQLPVGGRFSVRGYRENQLVRDNGVIASVEARLPLMRNSLWANTLQLALFVDVGSAWNTHISTPAPRTIASVGLGLRWGLTLATPLPLRPEFEIYWGLPLKHVDTAGGTLQDIGLHLQLVVTGL